jgi:hypothetical protein
MLWSSVFARKHHSCFTVKIDDVERLYREHVLQSLDTANEPLFDSWNPHTSPGIHFCRRFINRMGHIDFFGSEGWAVILRRQDKDDAVHRKTEESLAQKQRLGEFLDKHL